MTGGSPTPQPSTRCDGEGERAPGTTNRTPTADESLVRAQFIAPPDPPSAPASSLPPLRAGEGGWGGEVHPSLAILGVRVDDVTYAAAVSLIDGWIAEARDGRPAPHVVTTPNPEIVMAARGDSSFRAVLDRAALNVPDGVGLLLAAKLRRRRFREHVRGTDLVHRLAALGAERGHRWFLLGAADGIAEEAADRLKRQYPGLLVVGAAPGSPHPADDPATQAVIRSAGPVDLILVAYGAPNQERWLDRNLGPLDIPVGIGVGGVLNFLSGQVSRAPGWVQKLELEWLHRLIVQPWRWKRQIMLPVFVALALREAVVDAARARRTRRSSR